MAEGVKIRVLEVLASLRRAGAERVAVSLAAGLDPARFDCEVVSLFDAFSDGFEPLLEAAGIRVHHLGKRPGLDLRILARLASVIRSFRPEIVHTHSYVLRYALPARLLTGGGRIVHTIHNQAQQETGDAWGPWVQRAANRAGVRTVAVSFSVAQSYRELYRRPPDTVICNGIDLDRFRPSVGTWKSANGFSSTDHLVVSVARLEPQKNPMALIGAFTTALGGDPAWHLLMVGDGSLRSEAEARAQALGMERRIHFLGVRFDVDALLPECDIFAMASQWEGMPMAIIEAMAAGLPVVGTEVDGVAELVTHNTGLLVPAGETSPMAEALATLARDPRMRYELGRAAREDALAFGVDRMVDGYARLFTSLTGGDV